MSDRLGHQVLYTLGHACNDVVSWGSENQVNQMARLTRAGRKRPSIDVGAVSIRRDPRKSTMWCESTGGEKAKFCETQ